MINLSPHFTLREFTRSATADKLKIDNALPEQLLPVARYTTHKLEIVREALNDNAIIITSGYRCKELNSRIGGSMTSSHVKAEAVDFRCPKFGTPRDICKRILEAGILFDQLILEFDSWVHISFSLTRRRHQILTAVKRNGKTVYLPGLV